MNKRNMCLIAAAAAMVALAPSAVRADETATTTTTSTTTTTEFVPINIPTIAPPPTGPNGEPINYTVLAGKNYDAVDLNQARAEGFNDHDIAVIAKIADKSGRSFGEVKQRVLSGQSFPSLAEEYNLRLADVLDASDYQAQIAEYRVAYDTTGENDVRNLVAASQEEMTTYPTTTYSSTTVSSNASLADIVNSTPELSMFARALRHARLMKVLNGSGPYTIFAPTDAAFSKLSSDQINALMNNRSELVKVLDYHIIPQSIDAAQASSWSSSTFPATLEGDPLSVTNSGGSWMVDGANIVKPDMLARNGVIHEIDTVLIPPSVTTITTTTTTTNSTTTNVVPAPTTTVSPNSQTVVQPNGTTTTVTPNGVTTVQPNGTTTVEPAPAP
jgi:uncharacterized surface protein with fasciclin (FAS1) repeats